MGRVLLTLCRLATPSSLYTKSPENGSYTPATLRASIWVDVTTDLALRMVNRLFLIYGA